MALRRVATAFSERDSALTRFYIFNFLGLLQLWLPVWVLYLQRDRGLSLSQIAAMEAMFWLVIVVAELPTGAVADRWGRRPALVLSGFSLAAAIGVFGFATSYPWLLVSYLIWGVSMTLSNGANTAFVFDTLAAQGREREFARVWGRAQAWSMGAGLIGSLLGAPLAAATDLAFPIRISIVTGLAAALVAMTLREPPRAAGHRPDYATIMRASLRYTVTHARLRWMIAVSAVTSAAGVAVFLFTQPYVAEFGVPVALFGLVMAPLQLVAVAGSLTAHRLSRRLGERRAVLWMFVAEVAGMLALGLMPTVAAISMFGVLRWARAVLIPLTSDHITRHSDPRLRATIGSTASVLSSLFAAAVEYPIGLLADATSLRIVFVALGVGVAMLGGGPLLAWWRATAVADATVDELDETAAVPG